MKEPTVLSLVLTDYGGIDKLQVQKWPGPKLPTGSQVVVRVKACGLNFADVYTRLGLVRDRNPPFVTGLECSGVVESIGTDVTSLKVGDRVLVHSTGDPGLHSEAVTVDSSICFRIPDSMSFEQAAAFPVNYLTAYFCLFEVGNLREGQTVLIPSAAGGVGWAATQLAKTVPGVRVIGLASSFKHEAIKENGVDVPLVGGPQWDDEVRSAAGERGVDLALDSTGGSHFIKTQRLLNDLGRAILIGASGMVVDEGKALDFQAGGETLLVQPTELIIRSLSVSGFHLSLVKERLPHRYRAALVRLLGLYEEGKIKPRVDSTWTFHQIAEATDRLALRQNIGKVILTPHQSV